MGEDNASEEEDYDPMANIEDWQKPRAALPKLVKTQTYENLLQIAKDSIEFTPSNLQDILGWEKGCLAYEAIQEAQQQTYNNDRDIEMKEIDEMDMDEEKLKAQVIPDILQKEKPYANAIHERTRISDDTEWKALKAKNTFSEVKRGQRPPWSKVYKTSVVRVEKFNIELLNLAEKLESIMKSRLVVQDLKRKTMHPRVDPNGKEVYVVDTRGPTSTILSKRLFYCICSMLGIDEILTCDWSSAFCNTAVNESVHIYINIHPTFRKYVAEDTECLRLNFYLYGLRESSNRWYRTVKSMFLEMGFERLSAAHDSCILFKKSPRGELVMAILHVDDIEVASRDKEYVKLVELRLGRDFKMKAKYFGGILKRVHIRTVDWIL